MSTKILIDPGHGGTDSGAIGPTGLKESNVALSVSQKLGALLQALGIIVTYTRTGDTYPSISDRSNQANNEGVNYFISVHCNCDGPTAKGIETLVYSLGSTAAKLAQPVQTAQVSATGDTDRGIKARPDLGVLRGTKMPAILTEIGFISNPETEAKFRDDAYLGTIANAISQGTAKFLNLTPTPAPPPTPPAPTIGQIKCPGCGTTIKLTAST